MCSRMDRSVDGKAERVTTEGDLGHNFTDIDDQKRKVYLRQICEESKDFGSCLVGSDIMHADGVKTSCEAAQMQGATSQQPPCPRKGHARRPGRSSEENLVLRKKYGQQVS